MRSTAYSRGWAKIAYLEARDPERNIHRAYSIAYGQDLFGNWIVETTFGLIGGKRRALVAVVESEDEALQYVRKSLKRRVNPLPKRLGIGYKVKTEILDSEKVRSGLRDILLGPGQLYEALRERSEIKQALL